jgi:hypothetical protein
LQEYALGGYNFLILLFNNILYFKTKKPPYS